jgi:membrane-anchored glycerophosphoryl diester phosphodiesterase (GDPDase)
MIPIFIAMTVIMLLSGVEPGGDGLGSRSSAGAASSLLVLLFVPAVLYLAVRLLPLVPIVANSDHGPITALKRSFAMTRGNFWKLLGFVLLLAIAFLVAGVAISAVVGTLVTLAFGRPEPWSVSLLLIALVGGLIQAAFVTIYSAMLARIAVQLDDAPTSGT